MRLVMGCLLGVAARRLARVGGQDCDGPCVQQAPMGSRPIRSAGCHTIRRRAMTDSSIARTVGQSTCGSGHRPPAPTVPQSDPDRQGNHAHSQLGLLRQSYRMPSYRSHAVWLYHRFALSFRDVEDVLARRSVDVTYEAIRKWCRRFGLEYAGRLRRQRGRLGDTWHLDEVFVTIQGRQQYLWRAVDEAGDVLDILVQPRRNRHAAVRFFRKLLKNQRHVPRRLITDKLRSYSAACRTVMPSVLHGTDQYANNRAEVSHQPPDSVSARCGVSSRPLSSNGSRRFTVLCRICSESVDTSCDRLTTVCSARARSLNGMR